ncbi:MAG TPA: MFS transporter, partial [Marmoricola sp.]
MILVDLTIVTVATPTIIEKLDASVNQVVWVSSAYMLAYAVPVLITGRLGDRFGSKRLYLAGLTVFTLASLWCGLTNTIEMLILARVVQGFGASMMTPQTLAIITRIFPASDRGKAMAVWGATAGVAMVVGPILGGVLTDGLGWEWIFFVNIPVGILAFVMAWRLVPALPT